MAIEVIGTVKPKNGGDFPVAESVDVWHNGIPLADFIPVKLTQAEYDALEAAGKVNPNTPYHIKVGDTG